MNYKLRNMFTSLVLMGLITATVTAGAANGFAQREKAASIAAPDAQAYLAAAGAPKAAVVAYAISDGSEAVAALAELGHAAKANPTAEINAPPEGLARVIAGAGFNA
jgi:hypothetical protein